MSHRISPAAGAMASATRSKRPVVDPPPPARKRAAREPLTGDEPVGPHTLVKIVAKNRTHRGVVYVLGRNECPEPFNRDKEGGGGFYGCELRFLFKWLFVYKEKAHELAFVTLPKDAQVAKFPDKFKASCFDILRFVPIAEGIHMALTLAVTPRDNPLLILQHVLTLGHTASLEYYMGKFSAFANSNKDGILATCAHRGKKDMVEFLLRTGVAASDVALSGVASSGHTEVALRLCDAMKDLPPVLTGALFHAAANSRMDTYRALCTKAGDDVEELCCTAFRLCVGHNSCTGVKALLPLGHYKNYDLSDALTMAAREDDTTLVRQLISQGADVHFEGEGPLRNAAQHGSIFTVNVLLNAGADVNACNGAPLTFAAGRADGQSIVRLLLAAGADPAAFGGGAVLAAASKGNVESVRALLECLGAFDRRLEATHAATLKGHTEIVRMLDEHKQRVRASQPPAAPLDGPAQS